MMRWPVVCALLLLAGGAVAGLWHMMDSDGSISFDDGTGLSSDAAAELDDSNEAAMRLRPGSEGPARSGSAGKTPPALVARWRSQREARRKRLSTRLRALSNRKAWVEALEKLVPALDPKQPERNLQRIQRVLDASADGVARQNLIFFVALTVPPGRSHPWLQQMADGRDPADAEDALLALAFDGAPEAVQAFETLSQTPSDAPVRRLMDEMEQHEELGAGGGAEARAVLRSYRAIEVLMRRPYFQRTPSQLVARWTPHPRAKDNDLHRSLREAWIARYPGHPGADDMAWHVGRAYTVRGQPAEAARWYALASVLPDRDMSYPAVRDLLLTCEFLLTPEDVWRVSPLPGDPDFDLLDYVAMRRVAVTRGLEIALDHARLRAASDPGSLVGHAWNIRLSRPVPRGLASGRGVLPNGDPLLRHVPARPRPRSAAAPTQRQKEVESLSASFWRTEYVEWEDDAWRLDPASEALVPDIGDVAFQLRCWEALVELRARTRDARGLARADLLYKQAAVAYHQTKLLFPLWDRATRSFAHELRGVGFHKLSASPRELDRMRERFEQESYASYLAIHVFEQIEREYPDDPDLDKVIFSRGMAWKQLIDFRPFIAGGPSAPEDDHRDRIDRAIRALVEAFETLLRDFPDSELCDGARGAVAYWRRTRPRAFSR